MKIPDQEAVLPSQQQLDNMYAHLVDLHSVYRIPWSEIRLHNTKRDGWMVVNGLVYDVTKFLDKHPGGAMYVLSSITRLILE